MKAVWLGGLIVFAVFMLIISRRTVSTTDPALDRATITYSRPTGTQTRAADLIGKIQKAIASREQFDRNLGPLVELDPAAAAALLARIEPGPSRDEYLLRLPQLWAARDAKAALAWASSLEDQNERTSAIQAVCLQIAQHDPQAAIQTMESVQLTDYKDALENMMQLWAAKDTSAAVDWALARPEGEQRDGLLARVAYVMAEQNPTEAANLVVKNIHPGEIQNEAAISILHRWAARDWNSAHAWVNIFPEGPLRDRAQKELAGIQTYVEAQRLRK